MCWDLYLNYPHLILLNYIKKSLNTLKNIMIQFMEKVIKLAKENINGGWPFAAVIVKDEKIIAQAVNSTHVTFDPSDHAEIAAIEEGNKSTKNNESI